MIHEVDWQSGELGFFSLSLSLVFPFLQFHRKPVQAQKASYILVVISLSSQREYRHTVMFLTVRLSVVLFSTRPEILLILLSFHCQSNNL